MLEGSSDALREANERCCLCHSEQQSKSAAATAATGPWSAVPKVTPAQAAAGQCWSCLRQQLEPQQLLGS